MDSENIKVVKVRLNVSGLRLIGYVPLPPGEFSRFSDVLNGSEPYILIRDEEVPPETGKGPSRVILKDSISYVEALAEPGFQRLTPQGEFHAITLRLKEPAVTLEGELFVPQPGTVMDVFNDARRFINLRNVDFRDSVEAYDFLVVGKVHAQFIELS